jgi:hypothetical protein
MMDVQYLDLDKLSFEAFMLFYNLRTERYHPKTFSVRRERLDSLLIPAYNRFQRRQAMVLV